MSESNETQNFIATEEPITPGTTEGKGGGEGANTPEVEAASAPDPVLLMQEELTKYKEQLLRTLADFENYKKRARKEAEDAAKHSKADFLKDFLPVFDNLDRAFASTEKLAGEHAELLGPIVTGLNLVMRQYSETLAKHLITKTPGVGMPFDPQFHEAISQMETADHAPNTVIAEVQPGYTQEGKLIRAALVVVSKAT